MANESIILADPLNVAVRSQENEVLFDEHSVGSQMYIVYQGACKAVAKVADDKTGELKEVCDTSLLYMRVKVSI